MEVPFELLIQIAMTYLAIIRESVQSSGKQAATEPAQ